MARENNAAINFKDAQYMRDNEGYTAKTTIPTSDEAMTKQAIINHLKVDETKLTDMASNQLVPYQYLNPVEWQAVDPYCVQEAGWHLLLKTRSNSSTWCFDRFRLYQEHADASLPAMVEMRKPDGTIIGTKKFHNGGGWTTNKYEHDFLFDLSFNTTNAEIELYIKDIPDGAHFQQIYAVDGKAGSGVRYGTDAPAGMNAKLSYMNMAILRFGIADTANCYIHIEDQSSPLVIDGTGFWHGYRIYATNSGLSAANVDDIIIGLDSNGKTGGALEVLGNNGRTSASDTAYTNLKNKTWTIDIA